MKLNITLFLLLMLPCPAFAVSNAFAPPADKVLLLVGQDGNTVVHYVRATRNIPGGIMFYSNIQKNDGLKGPVDMGSGPMDGNALLKSYPNSTMQLGLYMVSALNDVIIGKYDANLLTLAQWIKKANRPIYLRIGYEFDNPQNYYDPDLYKQAFRYVVDFLRKEGVHNAAYVWHSYCWTEKPGRQWMDWYPGDDYVDWFGASIFSTPSQIWTASDFLKLARRHHKPFMIAESTPCGLYTIHAKLDWYHHIFQFIKDQQVQAFCYINSNWDIMPMFQGQHWGDARIEKNPEIKKLWLTEVRQDRYLKASTGLFKLLGYVKGKD